MNNYIFTDRINTCGKTCCRFLNLYSILSILLFSIFVTACFAPSFAFAEDQHIRHGWWGGFDLGAGFLEQSFDDEDEDDVYFFMGFKGGYTINPHLLVGLELSGWLLEAENFNDSEKGKGISQVFLISRLYPSKETNFFIKAGGGYVSNWSNKSDEPSRREGWGVTGGGGYDFYIHKNYALTPFATFSYGETGKWDYKAFTIGLGFTFP